jgi:hypothetical protein
MRVKPKSKSTAFSGILYHKLTTEEHKNPFWSTIEEQKNGGNSSH